MKEIKVGQLVMVKKIKDIKKKYRGLIGKVMKVNKNYVSVDWGGGQVNTAVLKEDISLVWDVLKGKECYLYVCYPISRTIFAPKLSARIDMEEMESFVAIEDAVVFMKEHYASYMMAIEKCDRGLYFEVAMSSANKKKFYSRGKV